MSVSISDFFHRFQPVKYNRVPSESEQEWSPVGKALSVQRQPHSTCWIRLLWVLPLCLLTATGGFMLGFQVKDMKDALPVWAQSMSRGMWYHLSYINLLSLTVCIFAAPIGNVEQIWEYDRSFGMQPPVDNSTEAKWDALIPSEDESSCVYY